MAVEADAETTTQERSSEATIGVQEEHRIKQRSPIVTSAKKIGSHTSYVREKITPIMFDKDEKGDSDKEEYDRIVLYCNKVQTPDETYEIIL